ncbi:MAG: hypothetical protein AMXMBFR84_20340 [Candidatus Hydrogenedentota bacterium]
MALYSKETIQEVLAANDIVDIVGAAVELKPSGSGRLVGLCPFHKEKTPSFSVNRDRQAYYCFGCEKGGDAIGFVMEFEGLAFKDAVQKLADRGGVRLPATAEGGSQDDQLRQQLLALGTFAVRFYRDMLENPLKSRGRDYLKTRALSEATVKKFGLGYAPDGWSNLLDAAKKEGFRDRVLEASGLVRRNERGNQFDFFRERLMVPIRDVAGNVVAFGGRDLTGEAPGKYVNSPENLVYKKGRTLYGLYEAREALRREKRAVLVEGYFDYLRCVEAGVENVVATCGTALTLDQAKLLHRYVRDVVLVYDGDAAGIRAALRGIAILAGAGLSVHALMLPGNQDPDDFVREQGSEAFRSLVNGASDFVAFYVRMNSDRLGTIEGRTEVAHEVFEIVASVDDELRKEAYLKKLAQALQFDPWTIRREFDSASRRKHARPVAVDRQSAETAKTFSQDDRDFIAALLHNVPLAQKAKADLSGLPLEPGPFQQVLETVLRLDYRAPAPVFDDEAARTLYAAAANNEGNWAEKGPEIVRKRCTRIRRDMLESKSAELQAEIQRAQFDDKQKAIELTIEKVKIDQQLKSLGAA